MQTPGTHDPYAALRYRDYLWFALGAILANMGNAVQSVAVGWDLYERTGSAWVLGGVGLVQVLPVILLSVPAGHLADRLDRRRIILCAQAVVISCSVLLSLLAYVGGSLLAVYGCLFASAVARAFAGPATASFWPTLIPSRLYSNAVTWRSGGFQVASVAGPAIGGVVIAWQHSAVPAYLMDALLTLTFWFFMYRIRSRPVVRPSEPVSLRSLLAGFRFVWRTKVILGAVTLDMFAVLLGGATALLPMYAKDILHVGPVGFGFLRAAPAVGALVMALWTAHRPPFQQAGRALLGAVAGFGVVTIVFGFSTHFWLSLVTLALTGAFDNISVVIRHSLVQLRTPDAMRGRVTAVNSVFISCSNELGAFESGAIAALFGPVVSVVSGGVGTILIVLLAAVLWPELRQLKRLTSEPDPDPVS
jgi:MFS family permease